MDPTQPQSQEPSRHEARKHAGFVASNGDQRIKKW
jgi:hypothetical protein